MLNARFLNSACLLVITLLVALHGNCLQTAEAHCDDEIACSVAARADSMIESDPSALEKSTLLFADAMWHKPSLRIDLSLRASLELLRKPVRILPFNAGVRTVATSNDGKYFAAGADDGRIYLYKTCPEPANDCWTQVFTKREDTSPIVSLLFSNSGRYLAATDDHRTVRIFDITISNVISGYPHEAVPGSVAFSRNEKKVASASQDGFIHVFDIATGRDLLSPPQSPRTVIGVQFDAEGSLITAVNGDGMFRFDLNAPIAAKPFFQAAIKCVAFSPDSKWTAAGGNNKVTALQRSNGISLEFSDQGRVKLLAFNHTSKRLAIGNDEGFVRVYSLISSKLLAHAKVDGAINDLSFSEDGRWLAFASSDKTARILDLASDKEIARIAHTGQINSVAFTKDSMFLITGSADGTVIVSQVISPSEKLHAPSTHISAAALGPQGKLAAIVANSDSVSLFDVTTGRKYLLPHKGEDPMDMAHQVVFSETGDLILTAIGSTVRIFQVSPLVAYKPQNILNKKVTRGSYSRDSRINAVGIDSNSHLLAFSDTDGTVRTHEPLLNGEDAFREIDNVNVSALAFSSDGKLALGEGGAVHIYAQETGPRINLWREPKIQAMLCDGRVLSLRFNRDGTKIAAVSRGKTGGQVEIYRVSDGSPLLPNGGISYASQVLYITFSHDGKLLAVTTSGGAMHLVESETGMEIGRITTNEKLIPAAVFSEDDASVWTLSIGILPEAEDPADEFFTIREFPVHPSDLIRQTCAQISKHPSEEEWLSYTNKKAYHHICADSP